MVFIVLEKVLNGIFCTQENINGVFCTWKKIQRWFFVFEKISMVKFENLKIPSIDGVVPHCQVGQMIDLDTADWLD